MGEGGWWFVVEQGPQGKVKMWRDFRGCEQARTSETALATPLTLEQGMCQVCTVFKQSAWPEPESLL